MLVWYLVVPSWGSFLSHAKLVRSTASAEAVIQVLARRLGWIPKVGGWLKSKLHFSSPMCGRGSLAFVKSFMIVNPLAKRYVNNRRPKALFSLGKASPRALNPKSCKVSTWKQGQTSRKILSLQQNSLAYLYSKHPQDLCKSIWHIMQTTFWTRLKINLRIIQQRLQSLKGANTNDHETICSLCTDPQLGKNYKTPERHNVGMLGAWFILLDNYLSNVRWQAIVPNIHLYKLKNHAVGENNNAQWLVTMKHVNWVWFRTQKATPNEQLWAVNYAQLWIHIRNKHVHL